jgi:anti-sigma regulatory factor (Ser/Thr protein kinase)
MNQDLKLEITLPNIPDIELVAIEGLERMGKYFGVPEDKTGEARIVVTEAIINALEHTGNNNPYVVIEFTMTKEKLMILIKDSGKGFDPSAVEEPDINEKINGVNKRGWGLKLMKTMTDDLIIESDSGGTRISIMKNLI